MVMDGATLIVVPVLNRPGRVAPFLASLEASGADADVLFMGTVGDDGELAELDAHGARHIDITWQLGGDFARKVNTALAGSEHPYIFVCGDDVAFGPGWLDEAVAVQHATGAGIVGTQDLHNLRVLAGEHATHWLITREYVSEGSIDDPRRLLHEGYVHNFVDDELLATAKRRDAWSFADGSIVEHLHPNYGLAAKDTTYTMARRYFAYDRELFGRRQALWT